MPWLPKQPDNVSHQDIEGTMRKTFLHLSGRDPLDYHDPRQAGY